MYFNCGGGQILNAKDEDSKSQDSNKNTSQTPTTKDTKDSIVYDLGQIETTGKNSVDNNATVSTVTRKDIENSASNDVTAALRHQPGVFYQAYQSSGIQRAEPSISIRGFSGSYVGFFIDGIPVNATYGRTDWGQFNTFGISEISVSKGYTSPIYGMNTLGGAVNMVTSKPTKKLEVQARYNFISNNEHRANLSVGGNLGTYYYQVSYAFAHRDSYNLSAKFTPTSQWQDKGERENSYLTNHTLRAKLGFEPNENHEYSLNFTYQKGEKGGLMSSNAFTTGCGQGNNECSSPYWRWPNYDKITAYVIGNSKLSEKLSLNSRVYYDSFYNVLNMLGRRLPNGTTGGNPSGNSTYDDYAIGGIFTLGADFDENKKLKGGINLKHNKHQGKDRNAAGVSTTQDESTLKELSTSIFAEYTQRISQTFRFALSGSYDRNDMLYTYIDGAKYNNDSLQGWTLQGILYTHLNEYVLLHANVGKKSRLPDLGSRYSQSMGSRVRNPNLAPESILNYELGSSVEYEDTKAFVAFFYQDINNIHIDVSMPNGSCFGQTNCVQARNGKEGYSYGGEIGASQGLFDNKLSLSANYSYVQRKVTNRDLGTTYTNGARILNYPNHIANANITFSPLKPLDFIATASYQSKMWVATNGIYSTNNDVFLMDLRVNYRPISDLQLSVGAYNLLDRNYYYGVGNYMAGRRFLVGIEYTF